MRGRQAAEALLFERGVCRMRSRMRAHSPVLKRTVGLRDRLLHAGRSSVYVYTALESDRIIPAAFPSCTQSSTAPPFSCNPGLGPTDDPPTACLTMCK